MYLDGARKSQTASTIYTFKDLVCGKGYDLGVDAFDDAGNRSRTTSTFASTAACGDVAAPSAPTNVRTVATTETQVILAWTPSTDDFGVVGYGMYVGGFWVGQWSEPSATITNLSCGQTYQIGIDASDAAGNESARTNAFFSTAPAPTVPRRRRPRASSSRRRRRLRWRSAGRHPPTRLGSPSTGSTATAARSGSSRTTSGEVAGLECGKTYTLGVDASDRRRTAPRPGPSRPRRHRARRSRLRRRAAQHRRPRRTSIHRL